MENLRVYKNKTCLFIVGSNRVQDSFSILQVKRGDNPVLSEVKSQITAVDLKSFILSNALVHLHDAAAFLGVMVFGKSCYLVFASTVEVEGYIADRTIYSLGPGLLVDLSDERLKRSSSTLIKYKALFESVELSEDFYTSFAYDLSNSLAYNFIASDTPEYNEKYLWNYYWANTFIKLCSEGSHWVSPLIHGFFSQRLVQLKSTVFRLTLIARRSRHHAGTRFNKRGVDLDGFVANEVETEQIVQEETSYLKGPGYISSFVMIRGSIPLFWQQKNPMAPKPEIVIFKQENELETTRKHFDRLFDIYGTPILCLNLIKMKEKKVQEITIGDAFQKAIGQLSSYFRKQFSHPVLFHMPYDFLNQTKSNRNVTAELYNLSHSVIDQTSYFASQNIPRKLNSLTVSSIGHPQRGVLRVNCIDCLDRTNVAMFCVGLSVLGRQLKDMGVISEIEGWEVKYTEMTRILQEMFLQHGDRIANQYGGSGTMHRHNLSGTEVSKTAGKVGNALTAIKRYYSNNFLDFEKQHAINLFLGSFIPGKHQMDIWDTDAIAQFNDVDSIFPLESHSIGIPQKVQQNDEFALFMAHRYDLSSMTLFDETLKRPCNVVSHASLQHANRKSSLKDISYDMLQGIDDMDETLSLPEKDEDVKNFVVIPKQSITKEKIPMPVLKLSDPIQSTYESYFNLETLLYPPENIDTLLSKIEILQKDVENLKKAVNPIEPSVSLG